MAARRILHVLGTADLAGNAICEMVVNLATRLDPERYRIEACFLRCGEFVERFTSLGIRATCVNWSGSPFSLMGTIRFARLLISGDFDLLHLHTGGRFLTRISRSLTSAKIIRHIHGRASDETGEVSARLVWPERDATIAASQIIADSSGDPNAIVIYPGIDLSRFRVNREPHSQIVVGTACRLETVKGLSYLIEAVAMLRNERSPFRVEIAGDGPLRRPLEEEVIRRALSDKIIFLGWRSDIPSLLASWDIFVLPSLDEGFGMAALEAMAAGVPVVASDVGGLRELVQDGQTGFLVPASSAAELASRISLLIHQPELREKMGRLAHERAQKCFSVAEFVRRTSWLYHTQFETDVERSSSIRLK